MRTQPSTGRRRDSGMTLPEVLISMVVAGTLIGSIMLVFSVLARTYQPAMDRVAESKDISFIQAWLPVDMASAVELNSEPVFQAGSTALPGTNAISIKRLDSATGATYWIAYRYENHGDEWQLVRYEIRNAGTPSETVTKVGVAHELLAPPEGWTPDMAPTHAIDVTGRNPTVFRASGNDITFTFASSYEFITGGAGLGPGQVLPPDPGDGFVDPKSPPSRCGGNITIVLDSSGSVGDDGMDNVKLAATGILNAFRGTPTELRFIDFDTRADAIYPSSWNGAPLDMLNASQSQINSAQSEINSMHDSGGTNWEDALRMAMTDYSYKSSILPSPNDPDIVIFVTDGEPTYYMNSSGNVRGDGNKFSTTYLNEATAISDKKGQFEVTMKGIFVGDNEDKVLNWWSGFTALDALKSVVGTLEWTGNGGNSTEVGNAAEAAVFTGSFAELGNIFKALVASNCGGTVTLQKRLEGGTTPTSGTWKYTTSHGSADLDVSERSSITFPYTIDGAEAWQPIVETGGNGDEFTRMECYVQGVHDPSRVRPLVQDGVTVPNGVEVLVKANEALSCLAFST